MSQHELEEFINCLGYLGLIQRDQDFAVTCGDEILTETPWLKLEKNPNGFFFAFHAHGDPGELVFPKIFDKDMKKIDPENLVCLGYSRGNIVSYDKTSGLLMFSPKSAVREKLNFARIEEMNETIKIESSHFSDYENLITRQIACLMKRGNRYQRQFVQYMADFIVTKAQEDFSLKAEISIDSLLDAGVSIGYFKCDSSKEQYWRE
jgi:hypothetical protein